ncbi:MAG: hypothetical protein EAZ55_05605 [Cytophagales bacterium]|nr:MAG: hypothetical protein EAZ55_05605 [Cytophagales bacterium]
MLLAQIATWLLLFFTNQPQTPPHDFHSSLADMQYNASTKSFEVILTVFTDDFEAALTASLEQERYAHLVLSIFGSPTNPNITQRKYEMIRLDESKKYEPLIQAYLSYHFAIIKNQEPKTLQYVGRKSQADVTMLYFEIPCKEALKGLIFRNSLITELYEDQVNVVNLIYKEQKKSFLFQISQTEQPLEF